MLMIWQYVTNQATRIIVRAVGELAAEDSSAMEVYISSDDSDVLDEEYTAPQDEETSTTASIAHHTPSVQEAIDYATYRPRIDGDKWILSETDLCKLFFCSIQLKETYK